MLGELETFNPKKLTPVFKGLFQYILFPVTLLTLWGCKDNDISPKKKNGVKSGEMVVIHSQSLVNSPGGIIGTTSASFGELVSVKVLREKSLDNLKMPQVHFGRIMEVNGKSLGSTGIHIRLEFARYIHDVPDVGKTFKAEGYESGEFKGLTKSTHDAIEKQNGLITFHHGAYRFEPYFIVLAIDRNSIKE
ncbi:MAG: hypothetical protein L3J39_18550 [Verrucomicrobiales bacterium]|nr:hypothetical protein [Verrucomicrobiales bacterium]